MGNVGKVPKEIVEELWEARDEARSICTPPEYVVRQQRLLDALTEVVLWREAEHVEEGGCGGDYGLV
jgi:hypothetical protein